MGRSATISYPNLRRKHRNWHVRKAVPTHLRDVIGTSFLETTRGTGEMDVAIPRRNAQLAARDQMVRVLGRATGCGPFKDEWSYCYEDAFDTEFGNLNSLH